MAADVIWSFESKQNQRRGQRQYMTQVSTTAYVDTAHQHTIYCKAPLHLTFMFKGQCLLAFTDADADAS